MITLSRDEEFVLGYAKVSLKDNRLTLKDPYKVEEYMVIDEAQVKIKPVLLNNCPANLTNCLTLSFKAPIITSSNSKIWVKAPFELEVSINNRPISVLTPFKVKFTVIGTPAEGVLCRWFPTELVNEDISTSSNALLEIKLEGGDTILVKDILIEDVNDLPVKSVRTKESFRISYGPVQASFINNHLVISKKKFQSKIIETVKTEPMISPWLIKQP